MYFRETPSYSADRHVLPMERVPLCKEHFYIQYIYIYIYIYIYAHTGLGNCVSWPEKDRDNVIVCYYMVLDFRIGCADKEQARAKKVWAEVTLLWNPESQCRQSAHWILLRCQAHKLSVHIIIHIKRNIRRMRRWLGHILRINCLLKHVIEGKTEVMGRRGRKCKQLLNDLKETRSYCKFKEEAPDCTLWAHFVIGCSPLMR